MGYDYSIANEVSQGDSVALQVAVVSMQSTCLRSIAPAAITVPADIVSEAPLQAAETLRLSEVVIKRSLTTMLRKKLLNISLSKTAQLATGHQLNDEVLHPAGHSQAILHGHRR